LGKKFKDRVRVIKLERMVSDLLDRFDKQKENEFLKRHFNLFFYKYLEKEGRPFYLYI